MIGEFRLLTNFHSNYALRLAPSMAPSNSGNVNLHLGFSLILAWLVVFFSLIKGIKSSGKVGCPFFLHNVYFSVPHKRDGS